MLGVGVAAAAGCSRPQRTIDPGGALSGSMPMRTLGRTGEKVSLVGIGGYHLGMAADEQTAIAIIRRAIDHGVTFLDNCWDYHDGESERRMGKALLDGYRDKVFLMTKIDGQVKDVAARQLDESLRRLQTDHVDLLQFHEVIRPGDPSRIYGPGGAIEAAVQARKEGKVRFIGFTGHKDPDIHASMIQRASESEFVLDTVQMPLNVMDSHFRSFEKKVLPLAAANNLGVIGMKPFGAGKILQSKVVSAFECLHYAMNLPVSVVVTGCERMEILDQALRAAFHFRPMPDTQVAEILRRTAPLARDGSYEGFKTTAQFDGTAQHPEWLG